MWAVAALLHRSYREPGCPHCLPHGDPGFAPVIVYDMAIVWAPCEHCSTTETKTGSRRFSSNLHRRADAAGNDRTARSSTAKLEFAINDRRHDTTRRPRMGGHGGHAPLDRPLE